MRTPATLAGLALSMALLAIACGGDGSSTSPSPTPSPAVVLPSRTPEPTPTPAPTSPAGEASVGQLAFVGTDGVIWLVNADGSAKTMFAGVCSDQDIGDPVTLAWSPPGDKLAVLCEHEVPIGESGDNQQTTLVVLDESGHPLIQAEGVDQVRWSPDGQRLAYQTSAQYEVRMLDLTTLEDTSVAEDAFLLEWGQPDRLLVGLNLEPLGLGLNNDAHWLDVGTGETEPVPRFDDSSLIVDLRQFWFSPDAKKAVVVEKGEGGPRLRVYDLETGEERPIPGSVIGFPSHGIPALHFAFSPDGKQLYWADANPEPTVIYRANMDGSGLTRLGAVPSRFVTIAGDGKVAYAAGGTTNIGVDTGVPGTIVVEDLEVGTRVEFGADFVTMAWRPTPWVDCDLPLPTAGCELKVTNVQPQRLNLRENPGTDQEVTGKLSEGETVCLLGSPGLADGFQWWPLRTADGQEGWAAAFDPDEPTKSWLIPSGRTCQGEG